MLHRRRIYSVMYEEDVDRRERAVMYVNVTVLSSRGLRRWLGTGGLSG